MSEKLPVGIDQVDVAWSFQLTPFDEGVIAASPRALSDADASERIKFLEDEVARLLSGDWTEEEIQQLIRISDDNE